jgi:hypothetical protein
MEPEKEKNISYKNVEPSYKPTKIKLRKRYNKLVVIDLEKRAMLRNMIKQNTTCEHKQIYTQANAICRRISTSYEAGKISLQQAIELMIEAHNEMSHQGLPKEVVTDEMNKRLDKFERGEKTPLGLTMAKFHTANNIGDKQNSKESVNDESLNKYSESYWAEVM